MASQRIQEFLRAFFKIQNAVFNGEQEKRIYNSYKDWIENLFLVITVCHHLASLVMPYSDPRVWIFLSHHHTHDGFLYCTHKLIANLDLCKTKEFLPFQVQFG